MTLTRASLALVLGLVLATLACAGPTEAERGHSGAAAGCDGVAYADVRGPELAEPRGSLRGYPVAGAVCEAWWLDQADDFVPQGLAMDDQRAFIVGHRAGAIGQKLCQVAVVDLPSGRTSAFTATLDAGDGTPTCRHGGGAALTDAGLWVVQTSRLWLLDPERIGRPGQVRRVWDLADAVRGSTMAADRGQIVIAGYRPNGPGKARVYAEASVLERGVTELAETAIGPGQVAMTKVRRVPPRLQGIAFGPSGPAWNVSSRISCGRIQVGPRTRDFVPGAEGFVVTSDSIWTVSEASASPYRDDSGALVPRLLRLDKGAVLDSGPVTCEF